MAQKPNKRRTNKAAEKVRAAIARERAARAAADAVRRRPLPMVEEDTNPGVPPMSITADRWGQPDHGAAKLKPRRR